MTSHRLGKKDSMTETTNEECFDCEKQLIGDDREA